MNNQTPGCLSHFLSKINWWTSLFSLHHGSIGVILSSHLNLLLFCDLHKQFFVSSHFKTQASKMTATPSTIFISLRVCYHTTVYKNMKVRFLYGYEQFCNVDCRVDISMKWDFYSIISAKCNIEPPNVTNANIELISGRLVGDEVYYKCAPGYETDFTITCLSNRQWSATKSCLSKLIICI